MAAYGQRPMALLNDRLTINDAFTAIHCTHARSVDIERFAAEGGNVCICPLTEANLADGIAAWVSEVFHPHGRESGGQPNSQRSDPVVTPSLCVGTD